MRPNNVFPGLRRRTPSPPPPPTTTTHDRRRKRGRRTRGDHLADFKQQACQRPRQGRGVAIAQEVAVLQIANTRRDLVDYFQVPAARVEVIYNGVSPRFHPGISPEEKVRVASKLNIPSPYLLFLGGEKPHKNLQNVVAKRGSNAAAHVSPTSASTLLRINSNLG